LLVLNLPLIGIWIKLLEVPKTQLYGGIELFARMRLYGKRQSVFDAFQLYALGLMGFLMCRYGFPTARVIEFQTACAVL
jgi:putative tricarboxylic transport membrane protein